MFEWSITTESACKRVAYKRGSKVMVIEYISSLVGWVLWGWVGFMGFGVIIKMIGSGFKATHSTSMFAVCGIFGLLLIQTLSIEVPFKVLFGL